MGDRHFADRTLGKLVQAHPLGRRLDREREHVEVLALAPPPESAHRLGEAHLAGVADHAAVLAAVPGVADELLVPHPGDALAGLRRGEDADHRADLVLAGDLEVVHEQREDLVGGPRPAAVEHRQALPVETPDAAARVAPGHLRAVGELLGGVHVGAGRRDLRADDGQPRFDRPEPRALEVTAAQEVLRLGGVDRCDRIPPLGRMVPVPGHDHRSASHG
jgi:hypothetical protein